MARVILLAVVTLVALISYSEARAAATAPAAQAGEHEHHDLKTTKEHLKNLYAHHKEDPDVKDVVAKIHHLHAKLQAKHASDKAHQHHVRAVPLHADEHQHHDLKKTKEHLKELYAHHKEDPDVKAIIAKIHDLQQKLKAKHP
jgi:hypothetical protein